MFVTINGERYYLWRAVDQDGDVIDILVQSRRNRQAAERFFRKLLKGQGRVPFRLVTDRLKSYGEALLTIMASVNHDIGRYANNRAEVSRQPTRQRERPMRRFKSARLAQLFLSVHGVVLNLFRLDRHRLKSVYHRIGYYRRSPRVGMPEAFENLRYPIGRFEPPFEIDQDYIEEWISDIETLPADLRRTVQGLTDTQLDTCYRPGGWTIRQVIHHLPDSHINSFMRFKWALTENRPEIKTYSEDRWAELPDYSVAPVSVSLDLLEALHRRWVALLRSLPQQDLAREFMHSEAGPGDLAETIGSYAWHRRHHLAHIQETIRREGWKQPS